MWSSSCGRVTFQVPCAPEPTSADENGTVWGEGVLANGTMAA